MKTLPTKWYIGVTEENREELNRWRLKVATSHRNCPFRAGHTLLSRHHCDGSYYYANPVRELRDDKNYNDYQEITLEQFRAITNPLPEHWYIEVTEENIEELNRWRSNQAHSFRDRTIGVGYTLLSRHKFDGSYYYCGNAGKVRDSGDYNDYQEITIEQFRQITNQTPKPMTKSIQITRDLLNQYYDAATTPQKEYLTEHFKLDGTTTDEAIRGLYEIACSTWKPRIKKNHPECFSENSKYFYFSAYVSERGNCGIVENEVAKLLGLSNDFIQIRGYGSANQNRSFFLTPEYDWELVQDGSAKVLIPTKKQKF